MRADRPIEPCASGFPGFDRLPGEVRLMIWNAAFSKVEAAVAVCSFPRNKRRITIARSHSGDGQSPPVAQACVEARTEWFRSAHACRRSGGREQKPIFVERTIFLVAPLPILDGRMAGMELLIEHIAIDIAEIPDVLDMFEALARFPRLRTIVVTVPSEAVEEDQVGAWQQRVRQDKKVLKRISGLVDAPSSDGEWHQKTYMGWLLCNYLNGAHVRRYYDREDGPKIRLFVDRKTSSRAEGIMMERPWALYFY